MIIFHEGMPRQGKSYAAMADHIIPALQKGRKVYARLNGAEDPECRAKVAEVAGLTADELDRLYVHLSHDDVKRIEQLNLDKDALIVVDELQNFWPQQRAPLPEGLRTFITEHGHNGWDILTMGQVLSECHKTWVNRTNRKVQFQKKDVIGKPDEYKWKMYLGKPDQNGVVKFTEVSRGDGKYDDKYFGTYKSHTPGTENAETYEDDRINVFKTAMFRKWLPLLALVVFVGVGYLVWFFSGGGVVKDAKGPSIVKPVKVSETVTTTTPDGKTSVVTRELDGNDQREQQKRAEVTKDEFNVPDFIGDMSKEHKIRLSYLIRSAKATRIGIEWRDGSQRVIDALDLQDIEALGWRVLLSTSDKMAVLVKGEKRLVATSWPIEETLGKVSQQQKDEIAAPSRRSLETQEPERVALAQ